MLYGVFVRDGPGGLNLEPDAWGNHKKSGAGYGSPYPAQVEFKPLRLSHDVISYMQRYIRDVGRVQAVAEYAARYVT